ncbi:MAG TPA: hypothetical protein VMT08_01955 [Bradyrhizobium sp.]|nr:hypothetical protein [Bradyrhizobium sp.]
MRRAPVVLHHVAHAKVGPPDISGQRHALIRHRIDPPAIDACAEASRRHTSADETPKVHLLLIGARQTSIDTNGFDVID